MKCIMRFSLGEPIKNCRSFYFKCKILIYIYDSYNIISYILTHIHNRAAHVFSCFLIQLFNTGISGMSPWTLLYVYISRYQFCF